MFAPKTKTCRDVVVKEKKFWVVFCLPFFALLIYVLKKSLNVCNYFIKKTTSTLSPLTLCVEIVFTWIFIEKQNAIVKVKSELLFIILFWLFSIPNENMFHTEVSINAKTPKIKLNLK